MSQKASIDVETLKKIWILICDVGHWPLKVAKPLAEVKHEIELAVSEATKDEDKGSDEG